MDGGSDSHSGNGSDVIEVKAVRVIDVHASV